MLRLLKADFYKLGKTKAFIVCGLVIIALAVGLVFIQDYESTHAISEQGITQVAANMSAAKELPGTFNQTNLFAAIIVAIIAASEFGFGTIKNYASRGFNRTGIYFSKLLVAFTASTVYMLLYSAAATITGTCLWGFGDTSGNFAADTLKIFGLTLLLNLAFAALYVMIASLIRQAGGAIAVNIAVISFAAVFVQLAQMAIYKLCNVDIKISDYMISTVMGDVVGSMTVGGLTGDLVTRALIVGFGYMIVTTVIGLWAFNKRDIK